VGIGSVGGGVGSVVLEDPTGRRARWMRWAGRCVFVLFLGWLLAVVLGGLGLVPVAAIPFAHALRPSQGPPVLARLRPRQPSTSDLLPAVPAQAFAARVSRAGQHGRSATAPGQTKTSTSSTVSPGRSTTAPGQTKTNPSSTVSRGRSATAPGQTKTSTSSSVHVRTTTAPGKTKTNPSSTVSSGRNTTAPGQAKTISTSTVPSKKP